jgi:hypothetical protein
MPPSNTLAIRLMKTTVYIMTFMNHEIITTRPNYGMLQVLLHLGSVVMAVSCMGMQHITPLYSQKKAGIKVPKSNKINRKQK